MDYNLEGKTDEEKLVVVQQVGTSLIQTHAQVPVDVFVVAAIDACVRCIRFAQKEQQGVDMDHVQALEHLALIVNTIKQGELSEAIRRAKQH